MLELGILELIRFAREHSPFYQNLYASLPDRDLELTELPVIDQSSFWRANTLKDNQILTGPIRDGIVFKSGGTTGSPKFSVFSKTEWEIFTDAFGKGIGKGGLRDGDRVGNIFYAGDLYGSFLFITKSIEKAPLQILQLPIVGSTPPEEIFRTVQNFEVNVIAGVPTSILGFADLVEQKRKKSPLLNVRIDRILFGGESFHPDQRARLNAIFPGVEILSVGYASTDAGLLGYADRSCLPNEHRFFDSETILELIDEETNQVITEAHRPGRIVITNLTRRLMPMIRYPVGDRAMWVENVDSKDRKFILLGRAEEGARVGPVTLQPEEILAAINDLRIDVADFQLILTHREMKDGLIIRIATRNSQPASTPAWTANLSVQLVREIHARKPLYLDLVRKHKILPIELEWVEQSQLEVNLRTGKLRKIIDQRFAPSAQAGAPLVAHS